MQEGERDHREHGVVMEAVPRAAFEVVEPELFFELLVRLLARPASFDGGGERLERGGVGMIGEVEFDVAVSATLADKPCLFAG